MIIEPDSPLRLLPSNLDHKQRLFFDGIRYCVAMADLAYNRLKQTLLKLNFGDIKKEIDHLVFVSAFQDGWSIIDYVHRLRRLLMQFPRIKQNSPGIVLFYKNTEPVEPLRNIVQHLETEINEFIKNDFPIWGELAWVFVPESIINKLYCCSMIAGNIFNNMKHPILNPLGKSILPPIDLITLIAAGQEICLSDMMIRIETLTKQFEKIIFEQFKELPKAGTDIFATVEIITENE